MGSWEYSLTYVCDPFFVSEIHQQCMHSYVRHTPSLYQGIKAQMGFSSEEKEGLWSYKQKQYGVKWWMSMDIQIIQIFAVHTINFDEEDIQDKLLAASMVTHSHVQKQQVTHTHTHTNLCN